MKIEVLGAGCAKCDKLFETAKQAIEQSGAQAELVKVQDIMEIAQRGIFITPALVVDGEVKISGKVPKVEALVKMLG